MKTNLKTLLNELTPTLLYVNFLMEVTCTEVANHYHLAHFHQWYEAVATIAHHTFTNIRQPQAMQKLLYHQPKQQDHAPNYLQLTQGQG